MTYYIRLHSRAVKPGISAYKVSYDQWELGVEDMGILIDTGVRNTYLQSYFEGQVLKLQVI